MITTYRAQRFFGGRAPRVTRKIYTCNDHEQIRIDLNVPITNVTISLCCTQIYAGSKICSHIFYYLLYCTKNLYLHRGDYYTQVYIGKKTTTAVHTFRMFGRKIESNFISYAVIRQMNIYIKVYKWIIYCFYISSACVWPNRKCNFWKRSHVLNVY